MTESPQAHAQAQTPDEELHVAAKRHYEALAERAHNWLSTVPISIDFYFANKDLVYALEHWWKNGCMPEDLDEVTEILRRRLG